MAKLIIFDTETTGLTNKDKIIQVGAIIAELGNSNYFEDAYNELCSPGDDIKISIESMAVHGIREEDIKNKLPFSETKFKKRFDELNCNENYLIAHNLDFDKKMLEKEGYEKKIKCKLIDTYQCALHLYSIGEDINGYKLPNHKLQTFRYIMLTEKDEEEEARKYNIEIKAHDALGDVVILKMFLRKLYVRTIQKYFSDLDLKNISLEDHQKVVDKMVYLTEKDAFVNKFFNIKELGTKLQLTEIEKITKENQWKKPLGPSFIDWLFKQQKEKKEKNDEDYDRNLFFTLETIRYNRNNLDDFNTGINF